MSFSFSPAQTKEHDNGALLGTFINFSNTQAEYSYYFENTGWLRFEGNNLYLGSDWHYDFETDRLLSYQAIDFIDVKPGQTYSASPGYSWRTLDNNEILIKQTEVAPNYFQNLHHIKLSFNDIEEDISVKPTPFEGYYHGALVAELHSENTATSTFNFNHTFFETQQSNIKLKDDYYYDPNLMRISDGNYYWDVNDNVSGLTVISFDVGSDRLNYSEVVYEDNIFDIFSQAIITDIPYFAGSPVSEKNKSGIENLDALLYDKNVFWDSNALYTGDTTKTVITFSFVPEDTSEQKFSEKYEAPNPKIDQIISFEERHKVAARQALDEWAKVADIQFLELDESAGKYGTIRFGFTNHDKDGDIVAWARPPGTGPKNGDIWFNSERINNDYLKGTSTGFADLLHEIGHALGLEHPFEGTDQLAQTLDYENYTLMSYSTPENAWFHDTHDKSEYLISSTPMVYDIAAIQYLYGAARYNEGNTSYKYDRDQPFVETIWDSGGYDTLDLTGFTKNCIISLIPGSYSTLVCSNWTMEDNLGIAQGAFLEKVIAGSGNDTITGNSKDNHLIGNSGRDIIDGGSGNDTIEGGSGNDVLTGGLGADQFIFYTGDNQDTIIDFDVYEDEVQFYNPQGLALDDSQISLRQNSNGEAVYSTNDGTSVTLEGVSLSEIRDANRTSVQEKLEELQAKYDVLLSQYNESLARLAELEAKLETFTAKATEIEPPTQPQLTPVPEPMPTFQPEQPVSISEPTQTPSFPEPTGINKILVEKFGYEWVNGKAWKPGTAPEAETPFLPEPTPTLEPSPEPTPEPEQTAPTPEPKPEPDQTPAPDIELTLAKIESAPTGISKILVENFGYEWVEGKYYSKGTAPELNLEGDAIHTVTVSKVGNQNVFFIDGNSNPDFVIEAEKTYRFDLSDVSNTNHPLNFFSEAGSDIAAYVEVSGTAGTEGAYVELNFDTGDISNIDGSELSYYCEIHGAAMGNDIEVTNLIA